MPTGRLRIILEVTPSDRRRLEAIVRDRNAPQKHVWRAAIVLHSADGVGTVEIMRRTGRSKTCVWRWQERFAEAGVDGLLRDKTRPSRIAPLDQAVVDRVIALTASFGGAGTCSVLATPTQTQRRALDLLGVPPVP